MSRLVFLFMAAACVIFWGASPAQAQNYCREFTSTSTIGNRTQETVGTACLNPDGSWQIVSGVNRGARFYDHGPNGYGSNQVTYIQQPHVTYAQPQAVNYIWRERVYTPSSRVIIINRGHTRPYYHHVHRNQRPWGWQQRHGYSHRHHKFVGHNKPHGGKHHGHRQPR